MSNVTSDIIPNPGVLGILLFISPVVYMYFSTLSFKTLKTSNSKSIKDEELTIALIIKNGNHIDFDLDSLDFFINAKERFNAYYESHYSASTSKKQTIGVYAHQVAGHTKEGKVFNSYYITYILHVYITYISLYIYISICSVACYGWINIEAIAKEGLVR